LEPLDGELALASHWFAMPEVLTHCRVCKEDVAESAPVCPKCGATSPAQAEKGFNWVRLSVALVLILVLVVFLIIWKRLGFPDL
jgi:hypothetical protein